jgi:hypothetical protein
LSLLPWSLRTMDSFWWKIWVSWHFNFNILHILESPIRFSMWPCIMNLEHFHRNTLNTLLTKNWQVWRKNLKSWAPPMAPPIIKTLGLGRNMCSLLHRIREFINSNIWVFLKLGGRSDGIIEFCWHFSRSSRAWCNPFNKCAIIDMAITTLKKVAILED